MCGSTSCTFFITTLTFRFQHAVHRVHIGIDEVAADIEAGVGVEDVEPAGQIASTLGTSVLQAAAVEQVQHQR